MNNILTTDEAEEFVDGTLEKYENIEAAHLKSLAGTQVEEWQRTDSGAPYRLTTEVTGYDFGIFVRCEVTDRTQRHAIAWKSIIRHFPDFQKSSVFGPGNVPTV